MQRTSQDNGTGASPVSSFVSRTRIVLPVPGANGEELSALVQPIGWEDVLSAMKRLPGGVPGALKEQEKAEAERLARVANMDMQALIESMDDLAADYNEMLPTFKHIISLGVVEPLFQFPDDPPAVERVPWRMVAPRNQMALFNGVLQASGFRSEAAKSVERFRDGDGNGDAGGVGDVRPAAVHESAPVRAVGVPRNPGRGGEGKRTRPVASRGARG